MARNALCLVKLSDAERTHIKKQAQSYLSMHPDATLDDAMIEAARAEIELLKEDEKTLLAEARKVFEGDKPAKTDNQTPKEIDFAASEAFADRLLAGESFKTIVQARKALTTQEIQPGTDIAKKADEAIELAGVLAARKIVETGRKESKTDEQIFDELAKLAEQMPSLNVRSSTSIAQQAYSTPLPLAYVASVRAGINFDTTVVEPTGGNGALVIGADPAKTLVNELNPDRFAALNAQGFEALNKDATKFDFGKRDTDVVIANPPFGVIKDENGDTITFTITPQYKTNEIDHAISLNALKAMSDKGKAVLIVGGPAKTLSEEGRSNAYNGKAKRAFYYTLYNEYNVTDHFTVSGDLYAKQGAAWPVDVIVIDGTGKSSLILPAANLPRIINSIEELKHELTNHRSGLQQTGVTVEQAAKNSTETGDAGDDLGNSANEFNDRNDQDGQPDDVLHGLSASAEEYGREQSGVSNGGDNTGSGNANRPAKRDVAVENKFQAEYVPASAVNPVGTLVPVNMQASTETALQRIIDKHGNIDEYIAKQLGYKPDEIGKYFSAEQVDAIALALDNINAGKGFIIGDQTGVGKGRVNAAMIRYAIKNKIIPIFVTEKPNLYGDMIRDLTDIGMSNIKPLPTNNGFDIPLDQEAQEWYSAAEKAKEEGETPPKKYGQFMKTPGGKKHTESLQKMIESGQLEGADVIFTTYSQMQTVKGEKTIRMDFLEKMADGGLVILDESHNAGGTTVTQKRSKNGPDEGEKSGRAAVARKMVSLAKGVFYSSATYAKRPDVLDLYSKTDMGLVADPDSLKTSLVAGGVPLQQAVASMLAKAGQYIRREKSFDGIVYDTVTAEVDREFAEKASEVMREIMKFDVLKAESVKAISDSHKANAATIRSDMATGQVGATSSNFTSVMHNMIGQMLLTLKVKPTIEEALAALKRGEKPVIALSNTMGSAIDEYVKDAGLNPGDAIGLNFGDLLKRYAYKSRRVTEGSAYGKKTVRELTDQELGPVAASQFKKIIKLIDGFDYAEYQVSPIDAIHSGLAKEGYKSGEITGRQSMIDYSENTPIYRRRPAQQTTAAGKRKTINDFNNGLLDVVILNQSGATGLSLHSSPKVGGDTRKRHMIITQAELNIDTHMQMLGRINRTGQIVLPSYAQLVANIPAEKRPAAILAKKMAMLNANTTAGKDSAVKAKDVPDFMNDYGDEVAALIMNDNRDLHAKLGSPLSKAQSGDGFEKDGAMRKVTGRIPVLTLKDQEELYKAIEDEYNEYIDMLTKTGQNQLEAQAMDLGAKTENVTEVVPPIENSASPFAEGVNAEIVDVKKLGKPFTFEQITELVAKQGITDLKTAEEFVNAFKAKIVTAYESQLSAVNKMPEDDAMEVRKKEGAKDYLEHQKSIVSRFVQTFRPGIAVKITSPLGIEYLGITGKLEQKSNSKNYFALGQWKLTVYVADAAKSFTLPLSKFGGDHGWEINPTPLPHVKEALLAGASVTREHRIILTGNMLAAYGFNSSGQIVNYTKDSGEINQGVLMPKAFVLSEAIAAKPIIFSSPDMAISFTQMTGINPSMRSADNSVRLISAPNSGAYNLYVPASKSKGGAIFTNKRLTDIIGDFYKRGSEMYARVMSGDIADVLRILYPITGPLQPVVKEDGKKLLDSKGIKYSKAEKPASDFARFILNELNKETDFGRFPVSSSKDIKTVFAEIIPIARYTGWNAAKLRHEFVLKGDEKPGASFEEKAKARMPFYVYENAGDIWLDVSQLKTGSGGSAIYFAAGNYAYNTQQVFIGDPDGLSPDAVVRRTANMLALAIRFGTTKFMEPSSQQLFGDDAEGIAPLEWEGNDEQRIMSLIETFLKNLETHFPEISNARYDFERGIFLDAHSQPILREDFDRLRQGADVAGASKARAGATTTRQGIFLKSLVSLPAGERSELLQKLQRWDSTLSDRGLGKLFSRTRNSTGASVAEITKALPPQLKALLSTGKFHVITTDEAEALGADRNANAFYVPETDNVYFVADNINPDQLEGLGLHEIAVHALMLGKDSSEFQAILKQVEQMRDAGNEQVNEAFSRVPDSTDQEDRTEEALAYLVENNPRLPVVRKFIAWLRHAIRNLSKGMTGANKLAFVKWANQLKPDDLVFMAQEAMKTANSAMLFDPQARRAGIVYQTGDSPENTNEAPIATFNKNSDFNPENSDILYSISSPEWLNQVQEKAAASIVNRLSTAKTFNWWHKSVGTQFHKALIDKDFGRVFNKSMQFEQDMARMANEAADLAPSLLPKLESLKQAGREIFEGTKRTKDADAVGEAVFDTTLNDRPLTADELAKYTPTQQAMYKEFFAAINKSLDDLAKSEMFRAARALKLDPAPIDMGLIETANWYAEQAEDANDGKEFIDKAMQIEKLKREGYAPLMRFGQYTLDVVDRETGKREFFGLFETEGEAKEMEKAMREEFPDADVSRGVMSQNDWQMFKGVTPETMEIFAKLMNVDQKDAFQEYLKSAVNNRSAMKRLIHRKKMPGFAKDTQRVLASFITSNARAASKNYHMGDMVDAITRIPKNKGDVIDEAVNLYNYVQNPSEKGAAIRGLLFTWYLGGSVASALVNMTQTFITTLPYLHQFGSTGKVKDAIMNAMAMAAKPIESVSGELGAALKRAEEEGVTAPHELHMLYGESMRTGVLQSKAFRPLSKAWGSLFSLAEAYNRRVAFIAAYHLAPNKDSAYQFASEAVDQTQFVYSKSARPNWARSTVGSMVFTFKTFMINYLEFLSRLPTQERLIALGVLVLFSGLGGLPGADDLDDVLDTFGQHLGYNTNSKAWKERVLSNMVGKEAAQYALYGMSHGLPVDVSQRLSAGNIVPGSALFKRTETNKSRDVMEFVGPVGSLGQKLIDAFDSASGRDSLSGKAGAIGSAVMPKAIGDVIQAIDMAQTGQYRDLRGRKVVDTDLSDAIFKGIGLQPASVAEPRRAERYLNQDVTMAKTVEGDIAELWARGIYEKDADKIAEAKSMLADWNSKNPETPVKVKMNQVIRRTKQMRMSSGQRLMKSTPKELRGYARQMIE